MEHHQNNNNIEINNNSISQAQQSPQKILPDINIQSPPPLKVDDNKNYQQEMRLKHQIKAKKQAKPFCFSKMLVKCPCLILLFVGLFIIFALSLIIGLGVFKFDESGNRTYLVWSADVVEAYDEITLAEGLVRDSIFSGNSIPHSAQYDDWMAFLVYKAKDNGNILDSENLIKIKQFEDSMVQRSDFQKFCVVNHSNPTVDICDQSSFASTLFSKLFDGVDLNDQSAINAKALSISNNALQKSLIGKQLSATNLRAQYARSIITFASPIEGYKNIFENQDAQREKFIQFNIDLDDYAKNSSTSNLDILFGSRPLLSHQLAITANSDLFLAVASFLSVYLYVTIHLRSFILASFGMLQTLLAFPVAYFFYRVIFQISFFTTIHNLAIFIILGVAADDLFVFNDAWRQSGKFKLTKGDLNKRMALTYRRASKAMFVTSFTTSSAFLATGFSDIMPISSFGYFASILILSNYCLVITMFPAFLIFQEKKCGKFLIWQQCCCKCKKKIQKKNSSSSVRILVRKGSIQKDNNQSLENEIPLNKDSKSHGGIQQINEREIVQQLEEIDEINGNNENNENENSQNKSNHVSQPDQQVQQQQQSEIQKLGCLQKFFSTKFNFFVRKCSVVILIILLIWVGIASYYASNMKPLSEQQQWLPDENRVNQTFEIIGNEFPRNKDDSLIKVTLFWGVSGIDKSSTNRWDDSYIGQIQWDPLFDISNPDSQELFLTFCEEIKTYTGHVVNATPSGGGEVLCFMQGFKNWLTSNSKIFPVPQNNFYSELQLFTQDNAASLLYRNDGTYGFEQGKVRIASIDAVTTIEFREPSSRKDPVIDYWNNVIKGFNDRARSNPNTEGLSQGKVSGGDGFAWSASEKAFVSNAVRGMIISGILAFFVLVLSTCNLIVGTYAIVGIAGVIVSVVSVMVFQGWQFGVSESLAVVILIGFSVDYVVHLANHYVQSLSPKRHQRMRESYGQIGISIIGGAITTFLSGAVLFGTKLLIFFKFATLITLTVVFSLIFSLLGFGSISHLIGPQNMFGSLWCIFCCNKCKRKNKKGNLEKANQAQNNNANEI